VEEKRKWEKKKEKYEKCKVYKRHPSFPQELFLDFLDIKQGVLLDSRILRKGGNAGK